MDLRIWIGDELLAKAQFNIISCNILILLGTEIRDWDGIKKL